MTEIIVGDNVNQMLALAEETGSEAGREFIVVFRFKLFRCFIRVFWVRAAICLHGGTRYGNCGRYLAGVIEGYDKDMAYDVYMNEAFMCTCGQVIRPVKGWK